MRARTLSFKNNNRAATAATAEQQQSSDSSVNSMSNLFKEAR